MKKLGTAILSTAILLSACGSNGNSTTEKETNKTESIDKQETKTANLGELLKKKDTIIFTFDDLKGTPNKDSVVTGALHSTGDEIAYYNFGDSNYQLGVKFSEFNGKDNKEALQLLKDKNKEYIEMERKESTKDVVDTIKRMKNNNEDTSKPEQLLKEANSVTDIQPKYTKNIIYLKSGETDQDLRLAVKTTKYKFSTVNKENGTFSYGMVAKNPEDTLILYKPAESFDIDGQKYVSMAGYDGNFESTAIVKVDKDISGLELPKKGDKSVDKEVANFDDIK